MTASEFPERRPLLDIAGVAVYLGITERHVRRLVFDRRIPHLKLGNRLRFDPERLVDWLDTLRVDDAVTAGSQAAPGRTGLRPRSPAATMDRRSRPRPVPEPPDQPQRRDRR